MPKYRLASVMGVKLIGLPWSKATKKAILLLNDAGIGHDFINLEETNSRKMEMMVALTGRTEIPQMFVDGVSYVGNEQISGYIRSGL